MVFVAIRHHVYLLTSFRLGRHVALYWVVECTSGVSLVIVLCLVWLQLTIDNVIKERAPLHHLKIFVRNQTFTPLLNLFHLWQKVLPACSAANFSSSSHWLLKKTNQLWNADASDPSVRSCRMTDTSDSLIVYIIRIGIPNSTCQGDTL